MIHTGTPDLMTLIKSMQNLTTEQVIAKLSEEIETLRCWMIEYGEGDTTLFREKVKTLRDKIEERERFEQKIKSTNPSNN